MGLVWNFFIFQRGWSVPSRWLTIKRSPNGGSPERGSRECSADNVVWKDAGVALAPPPAPAGAAAFWCLLNAVIGPVIWAAHSGVRLK